MLSFNFGTSLSLFEGPPAALRLRREGLEAAQRRGVEQMALALRMGLGGGAMSLDLLRACCETPQVAAGSDFAWRLPQAVRICLAAGDAELAERLLEGVEPIYPLSEHALSATRALLDESAGRRTEAAAGFAAAARWRAFGVPYEAAQALLGEGRCLVALERAPAWQRRSRPPARSSPGWAPNRPCRRWTGSSAGRAAKGPDGGAHRRQCAARRESHPRAVAPPIQVCGARGRVNSWKGQARLSARRPASRRTGRYHVPQPASSTQRPARRHRASRLLGLALILLTFALALPAGASAVILSGGATAAAHGHVTGTVTNASAAGLVGIYVTAYLRLGPFAWQTIGETQTGAGGKYNLGGVPTGRYSISFFDDSGGYVKEFYDNAPTFEDSDDVAVTGGATTSGIDATLAVAGHVTGTVKNAAGVALGGIYVSAVRPDGSGGWQDVVAAGTNPDGTYDLTGLPTGSFRIEFRDHSGEYVMQCYDNAPTLDDADDVAVIGGATTSGIDATLAVGGRVTGTVRSTGGVGLTPFLVAWAWRSDGSGGWDYVNGAVTAADGDYDIGGLPAGNYRIEFFDFDRFNYVAQFYNNKPTVEAADDVPVTVGATTAGIDATLIAVPPPTVALKLSGLKSGAIKLGRSVTASGKVTPISLAGGKVTLTVQLKKGGAWIKATKASATIRSTGAYSWKYKPARKGAYQMQVTITQTDEHAGATSKWLPFTVK